MSEYNRKNKYVDLKTNGRLFPSWVLANFKKYKLPEIIKSEGYDPCSRKEKEELRTYQVLLSKYLDYNGPYRDLLIYHGLGSGKTASTINIYNMLYNYTPGWNVFILLKASLKDKPWMVDLQKWLQEEEKEYRMGNIRFISYDSPIADRSFLDAVKNADTAKKNMYVIEEAHNFIRNVYTNISSGQGKRAQTIYDYIIQDKRENDGVRVVLLSATPAINTPYELALVFNLLRPGTFPKSEAQFKQYYVSNAGYDTMNTARKNNFQRRIMGLVSYYIGATPDYFASKTIEYIDVEMSDYQNDIYTYFEEIEDKMSKKSKGLGKKGATTYKSYTRQSCNFVFPAMAQGMTGETRPRPRNFKVSEKDAINLEKGKIDDVKKDSDKYYNIKNYIEATDKFANTFDEYLDTKQHDDKKNGHTLLDDIKSPDKKSSVLLAMHQSSSKLLNIIFNILRSAGPVLLYSNYVLMEGIQIFKSYLRCFGFSGYKDAKTGVDDFRYTEYHGGIEMKDRSKNIDSFNNPENKHGKIIKIMMISPAGAEGISLYNVRQVHIMEPFWHETRIIQMIGRAIRLCSHSDVFRYKSVRKDGKGKWTADQQIEDLARSKEGLIQSFLDAVREVGIDCGLNKAHNNLTHEYKCFQFEEQALFDEQIGPAFKDDIVDDLRINNGSNSTGSTTMRIKVIKIKAVKQLTPDDGTGNVKYSSIEDYWYNPDTSVVYDFELHYAIGKIGSDDDSLPIKINKDVYVIDKMIPIPHIIQDKN
jgi:superfamily II DNA or RNA helicase